MQHHTDHSPIRIYGQGASSHGESLSNVLTQLLASVSGYQCQNITAEDRGLILPNNA